MKRISIVILSYNDYDNTTGPCVDSLLADPDSVAWDIIVVDNASDAPTQQALQMLQSKGLANLRIVFNPSNTGYAAGNNVGIGIARGDVVVLLNSDTIAPAGMLTRLAAHFEANAQLGMAGSVTNSAGNEQCIQCLGASIEAKIAEGLGFANAPMHSSEGGGRDANRSTAAVRHTYDAYRMDFHCVAIAREVIERVGVLDEAFGRGYYEDFDYSVRVKEAGYALHVAEDVFIYHRGSTSFGKEPQSTRDLMRRNKQRLISKHGNTLSFVHMRDSNLAVLSQYAIAQQAGVQVPAQRVQNRIALAQQQQPRSWFKRWRYQMRLKQLIARLTA